MVWTPESDAGTVPCSRLGSLMPNTIGAWVFCGDRTLRRNQAWLNEFDNSTEFLIGKMGLCYQLVVVGAVAEKGRRRWPWLPWLLTVQKAGGSVTK